MEGGGVYAITNLVDGKCYVGSAINLEVRKFKHFSKLRGRNHENRHLQNAWNKYGENSFEFMILEKIQDKKDLIRTEQFWMDEINPEYNICPTAGNCLGREVSQETRKKISTSHKGKSLSEEHKEKIANALLGHKRSAETKQKMSNAFNGEKSNSAKLTWEKALEIRKKYIFKVYTMKMLAEEYGVQISAIQKILENKRWKK